MKELKSSTGDSAVDSRGCISAGLHPERSAHVLSLLESWCETDRVPAVGLAVGRSDGLTSLHFIGRQRLDADSPPVRDDAVFLVASITKPVVATGILLLVERGELTLGDRVHDLIPEFGGRGRYGITLRHLLTHTSGLPDMLPDNRELRRKHSPLSAFVEGTCAVEPNFAPGRGVQYQSMGFALLGEIIYRVTGRTCAQFLHDELFVPLGMRDTALGAPESWFEGETPTIARVPEIRVPADRMGEDWDWNSRFWRSLGAPWGGLLTTPADLARFAQMWLAGGDFEGERILSPATVDAATRNQLASMSGVPAEDRISKPWGLGWRLNWPAHSANFGDLLGPRTYGHWGATGTLLWIDPDRDAYAVVLTTQPQEPHGYFLSRVSNAISASL